MKKSIIMLGGAVALALVVSGCCWTKGACDKPADKAACGTKTAACPMKDAAKDKAACPMKDAAKAKAACPVKDAAK